MSSFWCWTRRIVFWMQASSVRLSASLQAFQTDRLCLGPWSFSLSVEECSRCCSQRQTLLFSATIPPDVHKIAQMALLPTHKHISTLSETDTATHAHVKQYAHMVPPKDAFAMLARLLAQWTREDPQAKVMVFANTARTTGIMAQMVRCPFLHLAI